VEVGCIIPLFILAIIALVANLSGTARRRMAVHMQT